MGSNDEGSGFKIDQEWGTDGVLVVLTRRWKRRNGGTWR